MYYPTQHRQSFIEIGAVYFWTATINNWYRLLEKDEQKAIIIDSLIFLSKEGKIEVYGFVIMPNHIHLIWKIKEMNGKETSRGSFLKYTAHMFKKQFILNDPGFLNLFKVNAANKKYEFWQRDSMAFELTQRDTAIQKLTYIHNNPLAKHWLLCNDPSGYYYSSAKYYETGIDHFGFLKHIIDIF